MASVGKDFRPTFTSPMKQPPTEQMTNATPKRSSAKRSGRREQDPLPAPTSSPGKSQRGLSKRGEATFERVMRIVATMYRERGYEKTSMTALARHAGLTAPAIYHYFGSKEDILAAFLDYTLRDLISNVQAGIRGRTPSQQLRNFMKALVKWQLQQTPFPEAYDRIFELGHLRNSLPDSHRQKILDLERNFYEICKNIIQSGIESGDFRDVPLAPTTFAIIAMGDYILGWYRADGEITPMQLAESYADLVLAMVTNYRNG